MPAALFDRSASSAREKDPDIQRLVRDKDGKYGPLARVLFPQDEEVIDPKHLFCSEYLVTVSINVNHLHAWQLTTL